MALSLDDKLLGEKTHYYCSSSEDEEDEDVSRGTALQTDAPARNNSPSLRYSSCTNTGPKGVINDWREYKRLEAEKREEHDQRRAELIQRLSLTCRSELDDQREKEKDENLKEELDDMDFDNMFVAEYRQQRLEEMRQSLMSLRQFGDVLNLTSDIFVKEIDNEAPNVRIIIHIYQPGVEACDAMNGCLKCLAAAYPNVKFCKITASDAKMSVKFALDGVPALLVYKNGELIGNFIRVSDDLGSDDFFATDVEAFLMDHSCLPSMNYVTGLVRDQRLNMKVPSVDMVDSDLDID